jgi:death-on-curing protein
VEYLTYEDALDLCRMLGVRFDTEIRIRDEGLLDSALHRPMSGYGGREAYPDLATKAAALLDSIANNHALVDGNKRLAWLATDVFLRINGCRAELTPDEATELVLDVAAGKLPLEDIAQRLAVRLAATP